MKVSIRDLNLFFIITFFQGMSISFDEGGADAEIAGDITDMADLVLGRKDGDSLFFSGRLDLRGDAAVTVALRNNLECLDFSVIKKGLGPIGEMLWN